MDWNKVIDKSLQILRDSEQGYVLMDMYNNIVKADDAAYHKIPVTPFNALDFIEKQFTVHGLDISKKEVRIKLIALLEEFDRLKS